MEPTKDNNMGASIDHNDSVATSAATLCFLKPDPLVLELCASTGPPAWVDLMLEEFAALLIVCRSTGPRCPLAMAVACQEDEPAKVVQWTTDSPLLSPVKGQPHVMPPREGQHDVMVAEASPGSSAILLDADAATTPPAESGSSATKRLKCFTDKILRKAPLPLLPQPVVEAQPKLPICSKRIAAQALSRVPASKRGEVLVMKRMGMLDG
jgi:hypothetical protein